MIVIALGAVQHGLTIRDWQTILPGMIYFWGVGSFAPAWTAMAILDELERRQLLI